MSNMSKILGAALLLSLGACPDPEGSYEDFLDRTRPQREGGGGGTVATGINDISGPSLLILKALDLFFYFETNITNFTATTDGATFDMSIQPLSNPNPISQDPGCGAAFSRIGAPIPVTGVQVDAQGNFAADLGEQSVSGCVSPLGNDITVRMVLEGATLSEDLYCGGISGRVTSPVDQGLSPSSDRFKGMVSDMFPTVQELQATYVGQPPPSLDCVVSQGGTGGGGGSGGAGGTG